MQRAGHQFAFTRVIIYWTKTEKGLLLFLLFFTTVFVQKKKKILHTEACSWDPSFLASTTTVEAWKKNLYTSSWKPESTQYPRMGLFLKYSKNPEKQKHRQSSYKYMCYRSGWNCCILAKYFFLHVFMHRTKVVVKIGDIFRPIFRHRNQ